MGTSVPAPNGAMGVSNLIVGAPPRHERGLDLPPARPSSRNDGGGGDAGVSPVNAHGSSAQLLFFDTFSHEVIEELNLDLVQFPAPVIVDEVRIIPLGARVQANFAGGVRLGATNPVRFDLECFVNDLSTPGASTFEPLGVLHYDQHARIHLRPAEYNGRGGNANGRKIPTDGLVLRGFYNAITLAVYGTFSKSTAEQLARAAQQQNVSGNAEGTQNSADSDMPIANTSSPQHQQINHASSLAVAESASTEHQKTLSDEHQEQSQSHLSQDQPMASWAAAGSHQASHDTLVATWASSAAANLQHQQLQSNPTGGQPTNSTMQYPGHSEHTSKDINAVPLQDANVNVPPPQYDINDATTCGNLRGDQHEIPMKQDSGEEWHPMNGGGANSGQQQRASSEKSLDPVRAKVMERQSNISDRDYRVRHHGSGDRQNSKSPRHSNLEDRVNRTGREQDSSSSRGRSRTPASRSRSPHSVHGRSITPETRSGRNRTDTTPTPTNGYENQMQPRSQPSDTSSPRIIPSILITAKVEQSEPMPEGDILDDVSDISEGDIPDIPAVSNKDIADTPEEQQTIHIDTASSDQQVIAESSETALKQLVKEEDVEEISDEEAEWSDDGDCMFPLDFDVDLETEDEWEEPIKIFDYFSPALDVTQPPKQFNLRTFSEDADQQSVHTEDSRQSHESGDEVKNEVSSDTLAVKKIMSSLEQLQTTSMRNEKMLQMDVHIGSDWVETIEKLTATIMRNSNDCVRLSEHEENVILDAMIIGLSIEEACKQPKPTYKVRHLKSSLKLLYEVLILEQGNCSISHAKFVSTKLLLQDGKIHHALLDIFTDKYTASTIRLLVLQILDLTLNCDIGLKTMLRNDKEIKEDRTKTNLSSNPNTQEYESCQTKSTSVGDSEKRTSGTKTYFEMLLQNVAEKHSSTRLRFATASLIGKINLNEVLGKLSNLAYSLSQTRNKIKEANNIEIAEEIVCCLHQVHTCFLKAKSTIAQPKSTHFLPLKKVLKSQYEWKINVKKSSAKTGNNELNDPYPGFFFLLDINKTLNAILIFMAHPIISSNAMICAAVRALLYSIIQHPVGMVYLNGGAIVGEEKSNKQIEGHFDAINALTRILLQQSAATEAAEQEDMNHPENSNQSVGLQLVHAIHALNLIDRLYFLCTDSNSRRDLETMVILNTIQTLHGMTFNVSGKLALTRLLTTKRNLEILIRLVKHSGDHKDGSESATKKDMKRSAIRGYACELLLLVIRTAEDVTYLNYFASELLAIGRADETSKLHELISWISPIENIMIDSSFLSSLCDVVKNNCENVSPMAHELVTAVRAINCLCLSHPKASVNDDDGFDMVGRKFSSLPIMDFSVIYLYSAGLVESYLTVLEKICGYHEQPHLHIATFVGHNGYVLLSVIKPLIQTLAVILGQLIVCQDNGFRDTSSINILLRTYTLCYIVPTSSACYDLSRSVCSDIIKIMLNFTSTSFVQPTNTSLQIARKEDSGGVVQEAGKEATLIKPLNNCMSVINNSMWQKMIAEVIKYTLSAPHTYLAGLRIFSELLPLTLPIPTKYSLSQEEGEKVENIRRLWSVRIYACETLIKELVIKVGGIGASCSTLLHLLRRVCVQLADLSPPIAKIIAEALIDGFKLYYDAENSSEIIQVADTSHQTELSTTKEKTHLCSSQTARILNLVMWLLYNGSVKAAFIEVTSNSNALESSEAPGIYQNFLPTLTRILNTAVNKLDACTQKDRSIYESHAMSQEYIVGIIQMLLDPEISLLPITQESEGSVMPEKHLANSLPQQEQYSVCLNGIFEYVSVEDADAGISNLSQAIRTLVLISYQDYGLLKIKLLLLERPKSICILLKKLVNSFDASNKLNNPDCFLALTAASEFLRMIVGMVYDEDSPIYNENDGVKFQKARESQERILLPAKRQICLSKDDVLKIFQWTKLDKQDIVQDKETELISNTPKSFSIGSMFGTLQKQNLQPSQSNDSNNHPLVLLEQLLCKINDSKLIKKEQDVTRMEDEDVHVPSVDTEAELIREQLGQIIRALNNFAQNNETTKEEGKSSEDTGGASDLTLQQAESLLTQFQQRPVFELMSKSGNGSTTYGHGDIECSRLETDGVNEDEQLNICYWNVSTLEEGHNSEGDALSNVLDMDQSSNEQLIHVNLIDLASTISSDPKEPFDLATRARQVCDEKSLFETEASKLKKKPKKNLLEAKTLANKKLISTFNAGGALPGFSTGRGRGFHRTSGQRLDAFRSRPANTSRPPSLHVDDFLLLQMKGQQPTGPTGYNRQSVKAAQELFAEREAKSKGAMVGFRDVTKQPVYCDETSPGIPGISHGADKSHSNMGWSPRGRMNFSPRGTGTFLRGHGRGGFGGFPSARGGWNNHHRSDYGRNSVIQSGSNVNVPGMNQERRFSINDNGGSNLNSTRRSTDRSSKDRTSGGAKGSTRR